MLMLWKDGKSRSKYSCNCEDDYGELWCPNRTQINRFGPEYFTAIESWKGGPKRTSGMYCHGTATAVLDSTCKQSDVFEYKVELTFTKLEDGAKLYALIREGKTWPWRSFENAQSPSPAAHAKDLLRELWSIVRHYLTRPMLQD